MCFLCVINFPHQECYSGVCEVTGFTGEILSVSSPSPAAKPVGKCYMDIEEEEGGDRRKETSRKESRRTDR